MIYHIEKNAEEKIYQQLYRQIRADILEGTLTDGTKLPSKRQIAEEAGISVISVEHALELLQDEGYIASRPRSGFYVCFRTPNRGKGAYKRAVLDEMKTGPGAPEDFPFASFARTMRSVLAERQRGILDRAPSKGCGELREAIASYLARSRGIRVSPAQIVIGSGAEYLYSLIVQFLGRERKYALEDPSYEKIRKVYEANGASCEFLALGDGGIVSEALRACDAGVLHVTPFHSYPSGITATAAKRHEYADWAKQHGSIIVEDDYDSEFASSTLEVETVYSLYPESVIYLNSFSKTIAPSFRTAYMVIPERLLDAYDEKLGFYSCSVPVFEQYVLAQFIEEGHLERYITRRRRNARKKAQA